MSGRVSDPSGIPLFLSVYWLALLVILAGEFIWITAKSDLPASADRASWPVWLFDNASVLLRIGIVGAGIFVLVLTPRLESILNEMRRQSLGDRRSLWLACHVVTFVAFAFTSALLFGTKSTFSFVAWMLLGSASLALWLLAVAPLGFWVGLFRRERVGLSLGLGLGMLTCAAGVLAQKGFWSPLAEITLRSVYWLLNPVYSDLAYEPSSFSISTPLLEVEVGERCSGYEGITLITIFLAIYIWLFRQQLRFPQVFWLFPLGILAMWFANVLRIAVLIAIGTSFSPDVAAGGFHSQAGWITFTLIAFAVIAISHRAEAFKTNERACLRNATLATGLLAPFLVLMAVTMVTSALSSGVDTLYPLGLVAAAITLWYYRKSYLELGWKWSNKAVAIGIAVFVLWMILTRNADGNGPEFALDLKELSGWWGGVWLFFRLLGAVIIVPLVEELAFRGYLLRKFIAQDFENVPLGQFTWFSWLGSSLLFGLLHEQWLAGTVAGLAYAFALCRQGQLGDAVLAHATSNALISACTLWIGLR
ncbi:MAG: exosortase E/protease, VPEID-CTERM system [Gammaproteobacteria bacterium]|nr:exosortase E/protease, VPEID-CTERM system [Gammaproteobacteria bacterium]